jgi:hypothetical protein
MYFVFVHLIWNFSCEIKRETAQVYLIQQYRPRRPQAVYLLSRWLWNHQERKRVQEKERKRVQEKERRQVEAR